MAKDFDHELRLVTSHALGPLALASIRLLVAIFTLTTLIFLLAWEGKVTHDVDS
jgi:hypothetical protein